MLPSMFKVNLRSIVFQLMESNSKCYYTCVSLEQSQYFIFIHIRISLMFIVYKLNLLNSEIQIVHTCFINTRLSRYEKSNSYIILDYCTVFHQRQQLPELE